MGLPPARGFPETILQGEIDQTFRRIKVLQPETILFAFLQSGGQIHHLSL